MPHPASSEGLQEGLVQRLQRKVRVLEAALAKEQASVARLLEELEEREEAGCAPSSSARHFQEDAEGTGQLVFTEADGHVRRYRGTWLEEEAPQTALPPSAESPLTLAATIEQAEDYPCIGGNFKSSISLRGPEWVKEATAPSQKHGGRTPEKEKRRLEGREAQAVHARRLELGYSWPPMPHERDGQTLLARLKRGELAAVDERKAKFDARGRHVRGTGFVPLAAGGLPPTARGDFAVASVAAEGADLSLFSDVAFLCARHGLALCTVLEADWPELWFWLWKRNVDEAVRSGKELLVLTRKGADGQLCFAQSLEVRYLRQRGWGFRALEVQDFCTAFLPLHYLGSPPLEQQLLARCHARPQPGAPPFLGGLDALGGTALHQQALRGCSSAVVEALVEGRADPDAASFQGFTPLMAAAGKGHLETVCALLDFKADVAKEDRKGRRPAKWARDSVRDPGLRAELLELLHVPQWGSELTSASWSSCSRSPSPSRWVD